jgi:CheY-like chemotaxis protein
MQSPHAMKNVILLVDGNAPRLFATGMLLQQFAYNVYTTTNAEEALQIVDLVLPKAIVTELHLPGLSGMDLLTTIKKHPRTKDVPVIILTGEADRRNEDACLKAGCAAYLKTPADPEALYHAIQRMTEPTPRSHVRIKTCLTVIIGEAGKPDAGEGVTVLSESGMYIRTLRPAKVGSRLLFTVYIDDRPVKTEGVVLYSYSFGEGPLKEPGMGVKFLSLSTEDRELMRRFIRDHLNV